MLKIIRVQGESMSPLYESGDYLLAATWFFVRRLRDGDVVVFTDETVGLMVKRIRAVTDEGFYMEGMNSRSVSTESMGLVTAERIQAKVFYAIRAES